MNNQANMQMMGDLGGLPELITITLGGEEYSIHDYPLFTKFFNTILETFPEAQTNPEWMELIEPADAIMASIFLGKMDQAVSLWKEHGSDLLPDEMKQIFEYGSHILDHLEKEEWTELHKRAIIDDWTYAALDLNDTSDLDERFWDSILSPAGKQRQDGGKVRWTDMLLHVLSMTNTLGQRQIQWSDYFERRLMKSDDLEREQLLAVVSTGQMFDLSMEKIIEFLDSGLCGDIQTANFLSIYMQKMENAIAEEDEKFLTAHEILDYAKAYPDSIKHILFDIGTFHTLATEKLLVQEDVMYLCGNIVNYMYAVPVIADHYDLTNIQEHITPAAMINTVPYLRELGYDMSRFITTAGVTDGSAYAIYDTETNIVGTPEGKKTKKQWANQSKVKDYIKMDHTTNFSETSAMSKLVKDFWTAIGEPEIEEDIVAEEAAQDNVIESLEEVAQDLQESESEA